jgi:SPP1 gp7 family putative phage head morphogenesis protein
MAQHRAYLRSGGSDLVKRKNELWYRRRLKIIAEDVKAEATSEMRKFIATVGTSSDEIAVSERVMVHRHIANIIDHARKNFTMPVDVRRTVQFAARLNLHSTDEWFARHLQGYGIPLKAGLLPQPQISDAWRHRAFGDAAPRSLSRAQRLARERRRRQVQAGIRAGTVQPLATLATFRGQHEIELAFNEAVDTNIGLISSIPEQYYDRMQEIMFDHVATAERWESLSDKLRDGIAQVNDLVDYRVDLIARDQSSKMAAAFNESRAAAVGITQYTWQTAGDERVRETHAENDGELFSFAEGAPIDSGMGNPGDDINCRCVALPYVEEAEEEEAA